jgi:hypothetical protein
MWELRLDMRASYERETKNEATGMVRQKALAGKHVSGFRRQRSGPDEVNDWRAGQGFTFAAGMLSTGGWGHGLVDKLLHN